MKKLGKKLSNLTYRDDIRINLSNKYKNNTLQSIYSKKQILSEQSNLNNCYSHRIFPINQNDIEFQINLNKNSILNPLNKIIFNKSKNISFDGERNSFRNSNLGIKKITNKINYHTKIIPLPNYKKKVINCIIIQSFIRGFLFRKKIFKNLLKNKYTLQKNYPKNYGKISNMKPFQPIYTLTIDFLNKKTYKVKEIIKPKNFYSTKKIIFNHYQDLKLLKYLQKYIKKYLKQKEFRDFLNSTIHTYSCYSNYNQSIGNTPIRSNWSKIINLSWISNNSIKKKNDKSFINMSKIIPIKRKNLNLSSNEEKEIQQIKKNIPKPLLQKRIFFSKSPSLRQQLINKTISPFNNMSIIYKKPKENSFCKTQRQINSNNKKKNNIPFFPIKKNKKICFEENSNESNYLNKEISPEFRNSEIEIKSPYYRKTVSTQNSSAFDKNSTDEKKMSKTKNENNDNEISTFSLNKSLNDSFEDNKKIFQFIFFLFQQYHKYLNQIYDNVKNNNKQLVLFNKNNYYLKEHDIYFYMHKVLNLFHSKEQKNLFYESFHEFLNLNNDRKKKSELNLNKEIKNIKNIKNILSNIDEEKEIIIDKRLKNMYKIISNKQNYKLSPLKNYENKKKYNTSNIKENNLSHSSDLNINLIIKRLNFNQEDNKKKIDKKDILNKTKLENIKEISNNNNYLLSIHKEKIKDNKLKEFIIIDKCIEKSISKEIEKTPEKPKKLNRIFINNNFSHFIFKNNLSTVIEFKNKIYPFNYNNIYNSYILESNLNHFMIISHYKIKQKYFYIQNKIESIENNNDNFSLQKPGIKKSFLIKNHNLSQLKKSLYPTYINLLIKDKKIHLNKVIKNLYFEEKSKEIINLEIKKNNIKPSKLKKRINNKNKLNKGKIKLYNSINLNFKLEKDNSIHYSKKKLKNLFFETNKNEKNIEINRNNLMCRPLKGMKKIFNTISIDIIPKNKQIISISINDNRTLNTGKKNVKQNYFNIENKENL
jgi:hypothetical protein